MLKIEKPSWPVWAVLTPMPRVSSFNTTIFRHNFHLLSVLLFFKQSKFLKLICFTIVSFFISLAFFAKFACCRSCFCVFNVHNIEELFWKIWTILAPMPYVSTFNAAIYSHVFHLLYKIILLNKYDQNNNSFHKSIFLLPSILSV